MNSPTKTTPKDFFLHLGATIVLYSSAIALVNLVFSIINYKFPDALAGYYYVGTVAWPISMLIVLVPVLYLLEWFIKKDLAKFPEKDGLWIRRWRVYLTLFLAGATIIGDLITLINTYLNGEISERFVYKFLSVLIIFAVIFTYFILEKVNRTQKAKTTQTVLAWVGIVIVLASIIGGFLIVGSPTKQRAIRFDNQRVSDLSNIQWQVVSFYQKKGKLPATLSELNDPISGFNIPDDPENKSQYEYMPKGPLNFEICANFAEKIQDAKGRGGYDTSIPYPAGGIDNNWNHDKGRTCFERTIDPQRYPYVKTI